MRLPLFPMAALAAMLLPMSLQAPVAAAPAAELRGRVIVTFKADAPTLRRHALAASGKADSAESAAQAGIERASSLGQRQGLGLRGGAHVSERAQVFFADGIGSAQLARRLAADAEVESVVVDHRRRRLSAPNDPLYANGQPTSPGPAVGQWYLRPPGGAVVSSIGAEAAWAITTGRPQVVVAVLDTGVRFDHADLAGKLLPGYDMISEVAVAADGDGRDPDPSDPGDFVSAEDIVKDPGNFGDCTVEDSSWHGTQTASLIGALTGNGIGMASVGRNVRVLPLRVLGKCFGYDSDIQAAMRWAAGIDVPGVPHNPHKAAIINMSLGSDTLTCNGGYAAVVAEVLAAGTAIVASAGNSDGHGVGIPANCPGVIAVAALRHAGTKVGYSDVGLQIALSAPGGNCVNVGAGEACLYPIITALNAGRTVAIPGSSVYSDSQNASVGTSFAAPLVAGTAALMVSAQPGLNPADLVRLLKATARPFPTTGGDNGDGTPVPVCQAPTGADQGQCYCTRTTCGAGMLDAGSAVQAALGVAARIAVSPVAPLAGQAIVLSAAGTVLAPGRRIATVRWALTDGGGIVEGFSGGVDAVTAEVVPTAAGSFVVSVTVSDDLGSKSTASSSIVVASVDPGEPPVDPGGGAVGSGGGGGGGGALGVPWLLGLLVAVLAVWRRGVGIGASSRKA